MLQDDGSAMKQDAEVLMMLRERAKGRTQEQPAARAGMSVRMARAYERRARLPSQLKQLRTYRSRPNPFADDWPWIARLLEDDPALQGQTLFGLLCERHAFQGKRPAVRGGFKHPFDELEPVAISVQRRMCLCRGGEVEAGDTCRAPDRRLARGTRGPYLLAARCPMSANPVGDQAGRSCEHRR